MLPNLKELWEAVLLQALEEYNWDPTPEQIKSHIEGVREDAREFVNDDRVTIGSFRWICDMLGLEHSAVRKTLRTKG